MGAFDNRAASFLGQEGANFINAAMGDKLIVMGC